MDKYDKRHQRNLRKLDKELETIYTLWQKEASALVPTIKGFDPSREFDINRYPKAKKQLDALTKKYAEAMRVTFESRIKSEWDLAQDKNDEVVKDYFGATARDMKTPSALMSRYLDRNEKALETFLSRKSADTGLSLSERVWKYADGDRTEIEAGLELAIRDGLSANETAKELKKYLRHPDKLFRRVRDKQTGKLKLSKPAKAFHPGTGVYRSSFQNARRLVATEVNIAYRTSDHLRWQSMDFVTGVEVKLSNNHTLNGRPFTDICDDLQGTYPKDFKFTGWHPLCRCYAVPVLEDPDRFFARTFRGEGEAPEGVTDVPDNFKVWAKNNADRISKAEARGKLPYFIKENTYIKSNGEIFHLFGYNGNTEKINAFEKLAKEEIRGKVFREGITISGQGIKEWLNQPFSNKDEKDKSIFRIGEILKNSSYKGRGLDKDGKTPVHIFETSQIGNPCWIIVKEHPWGKYIYSVSDNRTILENVKKNSPKE